MLIIFICLFFLGSVLFVLTHLHPLNREEIRLLANKRRKKEIKNYYTFNKSGASIDKDFKKRMNPRGTFYRINETLHYFPSVAAGLLKYKKHEWIIIAFEKNKKVELMWTNKGMNNGAVSIILPDEEILRTCKNFGYSSVLVFHNHPNSDPHYCDYSKPSDQDINSACTYSKFLSSYGINLVEFVCERGMHYKYYLSVSDIFLPVIDFINEINNENGLSKFRNLLLHVERIF